MNKAMRNLAAVGIIIAGGLIALGLGLWVWNLLVGLVHAGPMLGVSL